VPDALSTVTTIDPSGSSAASAPVRSRAAILATAAYTLVAQAQARQDQFRDYPTGTPSVPA
jgi:hypothetical protein